MRPASRLPSERFLPAACKSMTCKAFCRLPLGCPQAYPHLPGTTQPQTNCVWAFRDHAPQGVDMQQDFQPVRTLSSCFSTEGGDKSTLECATPGFLGH